MNPKVIGIVGFIASGKDTTFDFISKKFNVKKDSYAGPLKDACANIFGWDRNLLEGTTTNSRNWREMKDEFWSDHLGQNITPRKILQVMGTEVMRNNFHNDVWILSMKKRIRESKVPVIITDCRFPNEISAIKEMNGIVVQVKRHDDPDWKYFAIQAMKNNCKESLQKLKERNIHPSEYSWIGSECDYEINNRGSLNDLKSEVNKFVTHFNLNEDWKPFKRRNFSIGELFSFSRKS